MKRKLALPFLALFTFVFISMLTIPIPIFAHGIDTPYCTVTNGYGVCTNQEDYTPSSIVHIAGSGFATDSNYLIKVNRPGGSVVTGDGSFASWPTAYDYLTADSEGKFQYDYVLDGIAGQYLIEVLDGENNVLASHTFTDAPKVGSVSVGSQIGALTQGTAGSATYNISVNRGAGGGSSGSFTASLYITTSPPTGATYSFSPNPVSFTPTDTSKTSTLTITTTSATPSGSTSFTVKANTSASDYATGNGNLLIGPAPQLCGNGIVEGTEQCDGGACCNTDCTFKSSSTVCRAATGSGCDIAETCTGSSATCPADAVQPSTFECRASAGVCDLAEKCDGTTKNCPADSKSTAVCRSSAGVCDVAESCDGVNNNCPTDVFQLNTYVCRASAGVCDVAETCTGSAAACPIDAVRPNGYVCAAESGQCEADDTCDGTHTYCNEKYASSGTPCDDGLFCNVDETCNGAGVCTGGSARDCSTNDITGIATCNNDPDAFDATFDWRNSFTSVCDETNNICPTGDLTINHVCADADNTDGVFNYNSVTQTCSAECDGAGTECQPNIASNYCYYGGSCNTDPASCSCNYGSNQYCPAPGTIDGGTCYYGTQSCTESGCGLSTEAMGNYDTCDSILGPIDTIPPVIALHGDETAEATSASGATVIYTSPATSDAVDGPGIATCLPASGSLFALGDTTVTCNAQDAAGNHASPTTFVVHIVDTTPPTIDPHADVGPIEATSSAGAIVTYTSPAIHDLVDGDGTATCAPISGSTFALGDTTVTCNAMDAHGNVATPTNFKVTVADTTPPVVTVPSDITEEATSPLGNVVTFVSTATDIVDGSITPTCIPSSGSTFALGTTLVTCTATDTAGNTGSASFNVIVQDTIPPVTTLTIGTPKFGSSPTYVSTTTPFTLDATDSGSGVDYTEYNFDGGSWNTYSIPFTVLTVGGHTIYYRSVDNVGNVETEQSINIVVGATTLTNNGVYSGQYSDSVSLSATLIDVASGLPLNGKTITFTIGSQSASGTTDASGVATASITLNQAAGSYTIDTAFAGDTDNSGSSDSDTFTINKEDAAITYNGDLFVLTAGTTITTAPIRLSAHLDQLDSELGDLTQAKVTFVLTPAGGGSTITVDNIPVSASGDALTTKTVPVGDYSVKVTISAGNNYWTENPYGYGLLTVALGANDQRVTGGGWVPDALSANGKDNFGFTVTYNKNGAPKGNFLFMFRGTDGYNYQVKSNSWAKGGLSFTSDNTAFFTAKATLSKINRATGEVVASDGSYTFVVNIKDGDLTKTKDTFSITIFDSSNNIWKQVGTAASQIILGGGNVVVHSK